MTPNVQQPVAAHNAVINSILDNCREHIDRAAHLSESERIAAKEWLEKLKTTGFVETSDNEPARKAAVGGVQWAMEASLQGIQYIITPDRPTPFRTHGEAQRAHGQAEREEGLIQRMLQGNSLHLVFCKEGVGTPNQDAIYRREVLEQFAGSERLQEHYLVHSKEMFPVEHSGAFILAPHNGATVAFAIHAAQVDKVTNTKVIRLYFGVLESGSTHPLDVALNDWKKFLQDENIPFAGGN